MKILVTGGAGFIGSHIAESFSEDNEVVAVDSLSPHYSVELKKKNISKLQDQGVDFHELDLAEDDLGSVLAGTDVVIHFAAQPGISSDVSFDTYERNNIKATNNLLTACRKLEGSPFFINISTSSVYGLEATGPEDAEPKPASDYGVTKLAAEQLALSYHRQDKLDDVTSLRLFSVYGPRERPEKLFTKLIHAAATDTAFPLYEGSRSHVRSFTFVGDVVEAIKATLENKDTASGEIINVGSDVTRTTGEAIEAVEQAVGKDIEMDIQPPRPGDQSKTSANIDKARELLGYDPSTTLEEGVKQQVEWFQKNDIVELL